MTGQQATVRENGEDTAASLAAQAAFEAMFNHTPRVDTRTPAQVDAGRRTS